MRLEGVFKPMFERERIDFFEFEKGENVIVVDWDESEWWTDGEGFRRFYCSGVYFNGEYANGRLEEIMEFSPSEISYQCYDPDSGEEYMGEEEMICLWFDDRGSGGVLYEISFEED